jgi:transmembrane sensor
MRLVVNLLQVLGAPANSTAQEKISFFFWYLVLFSVSHQIRDQKWVMKKYLQYQVEDFVWDDSFRQWVLSPTRENDARWQQWLIEYPDKADRVQEAREMIQRLQVQELPLSNQEIRYAVQRTIGRAKKQPIYDPNELDPNTTVRALYRQTWFWAAASVILLASLSIWIWTIQFSDSKVLQTTAFTYEHLVKTQPKALTETINQTPKAIPIKLSDGSLIVLKAGSRISYSPTFTGLTRNVYLSGEAFFEVAKNPEKPFLIYSNGLITKVLGTSFVIKAYPSDPQVTVEVKTGLVAVFAQSAPDSQEKIANRKLEGIVLTPNQKVIYEREEVRLAKSLVENPQIVPGPSAKTRFDFDDTPVPTVFDRLEKAYGVDIAYDEDLLANCPLTAMLTDQPLFEKLDVICRVIEARYEVIDGQIIIYSRGCKP